MESLANVSRARSGIRPDLACVCMPFTSMRAVLVRCKDPVPEGFSPWLPWTRPGTFMDL